MQIKSAAKFFGRVILLIVLVSLISFSTANAMKSAPLNLDSKKAALLILHYQNDIVKPEGALGKLYAKRISEAGNIENTKAVLDTCRKNKIQVIHVRFALIPGHPEVSEKPSPMFKGFSQAGILIDGQWGAEIVNELKPIAGEPVLTYSSTNAFWGTPLDNILHSRGITDLIIAGIATTRYVVLATTLAANDSQYYPIVLEDCCNDTTAELHQWTIDNVLSWIAVISNSKEVINKIQKK